MHVLIAMDSFKGSLTSLEAGKAVEAAFLSVVPQGTARVCPMADGGEGTITALLQGLGGELKTATVTGPLGTPVTAHYGILPGGVAVLEMAEAAGLPLVDPEKRDPMYTTTYGVGELIRKAMDQGCRRFVIGVGGSATNDGGTGMLTALGYDFLDATGAPIAPGAKGLEALNSISAHRADPRLSECTFRVACDVTNPLCGPLGCSAVFAPQKGAGETDIPRMDAWLSEYARLTAGLLPDTDPQRPGAGAAGGMGAGMAAFLGSPLQMGIETVLDTVAFDSAAADADFIFTGEGKLDSQSLRGKVVIGVARRAKKLNVPVIAVVGGAERELDKAYEEGVSAVFTINRLPQPLSESAAHSAENLGFVMDNILRLIKK